MRLLAAPDYFEAHEALPWVALGWAMYGLFLVLVTIGGRAGVTSRNFPAALAGVVVNVVVLVALVDPLGIAGAGIALVAAYAVMLVVLHLLTRAPVRRPVRVGAARARGRAAGRRSRSPASCCCRPTGFDGPRRCARSRSPRSRSRCSRPASCAPTSARACALAARLPLRGQR